MRQAKVVLVFCSLLVSSCDVQTIDPSDPGPPHSQGGQGGFEKGGEGGAFPGFGGGFEMGGAGGAAGVPGHCEFVELGEGCGFCEFPTGVCAAVGFSMTEGPQATQAIGSSPQICDQDVALGCPAAFVPVCGCDGKTYGNDCERRRNRVSKAFDGPCDEPKMIVHEGDTCGKVREKAEFVCADGLYCEPEGRMCSAQTNGVCRRKPEVCIAVQAPVCGCDGNTYVNDCHRRQAGVPLAANGPCGQRVADEGEACGEGRGLTCAQGLLCDPAPGQCSVARFEGVCRRAPGGVCTREFAPVCGCDGQTYTNDCVRLSSGVGKAQDGECRTTSFLKSGVWGGRSIGLEARDPRRGGTLQFDCGRATIVSPLQVDAQGQFMWMGRYTSQAQNVREIILTGAVDPTSDRMKLTVQLMGAPTQSHFELQFGVPGSFSLCL